MALSALAPRRDERRAVETLLDDRCEALILLGPQAPSARLAELAGQLPVVFVARRLRPSVPGLRSYGRRRRGSPPGGGPPRRSGPPRHRPHRRRPGTGRSRPAPRVPTAMNRHGLGERGRIIPGGLTEEEGAEAARTLSAPPALPTAVLAFNDRCATGVLDLFLRSGVAVPGDISVVGFDDGQLRGWPTSTSPPSDRTLHASPGSPSAGPSHAWRRGDPRRGAGHRPRLVVRGTSAPVERA